jgi:hypothetical protein
VLTGGSKENSEKNFVPLRGQFRKHKVNGRNNVSNKTLVVIVQTGYWHNPAKSTSYVSHYSGFLFGRFLFQFVTERQSVICPQSLLSDAGIVR